jgi:predicted RNase H-like HicB family nuclease
MKPMKYRVMLIPSEEGFSVGCPTLPGCWSQGSTREDALTNIREAIRLWLEVADEDARREAEAEHGVLEEVII